MHGFRRSFADLETDLDLDPDRGASGGPGSLDLETVDKLLVAREQARARAGEAAEDQGEREAAFRVKRAAEKGGPIFLFACFVFEKRGQ